MNDIVIETLKQWHPNNWKTVYEEVEDTKCIQQSLIDLMRRCMPADDYTLFSLNVKALNELIDERIVESEFENYLDSHDIDDELVDFDIAGEDLPLSRFSINYENS